MADTGTIGLLGLIAALIFLWWRRSLTTPLERRDAFPFMLAVVLVLFPLNSHFAIYGTYTSSLVWFLIGLWGAAYRLEEKRPDN
jgi:hypothetical protein